jgi:hypothetical protein
MTKGTYDHWLNAAHDGKSAAQADSSPVDALSGVSPGDRQHLKDAFGIDTVGDLATHRFVRRALTINQHAARIEHDPGPDPEWSALFADAPLGTYQAHPDDFRLDFGPVYYRGRLDGTARVLVVGQDPAANELVGHRVFVGASGQRVQGFLRRIGIRRDYVMVNTFLYPVFGQFRGSLRQLSQDRDILGFRNRLLDKIAADNPLQAVIAIGSAARDAIERWPGVVDLHVQHITHPSARDNEALLINWNEGLTALRGVVEAELEAPPDNAMYGTDWVEADHEPIPRVDLPFGVPDWHGVGSHATRARNSDNATDNKRIIWQAP